MPVTPGHFTLSAEQRQFKELLARYPRIYQYWQFDSRDCDLEAVERDIGAMSSGEQIMLRFFVGVWMHENKLDLDFTDIASNLDKEDLQVIIDWLQDPVWP